MSNIEWTDATWNPVIGCTPVSSGCLNCYAATMARRLEAMGKPEYAPKECWDPPSSNADGSDARPAKLTHTIRIAEVRNGRAVFTGDVRTLPERLTEPLHWKKPRRVFVNSMSDLFHEAVPFEFVDRVFAVMALCPQHTFQVLTKRPERMAEYLGGLTGYDTLRMERVGGGRPLDGWPLPNVWLGTSVEDQNAADERIPHLLRCPAAGRFLSLEPLLEHVDLTGWDGLGWESGSEPGQDWQAYRWPDWVPPDTRREIESFWSPRAGRSPKRWEEHCRSNKMPRLGSVVGLTERNWVVAGKDVRTTRRGRFVPAWGNIGRVIDERGVAHYAAATMGRDYLHRFLDNDGEYRHKIHYVIVGGESGPHARPCDVAWIESVVDQCRGAGVPVFVKQLGAKPFYVDEPSKRCGGAVAIDVHALAFGGWKHTGKMCRDRKGADPAEWPERLRVRDPWPSMGVKA